MTKKMFKAGGPLADAEEERQLADAIKRGRAREQRQLDARKFIPRPFDTLETHEGDDVYPFASGEDGDYWGLGHLDAERFAELVTKYDRIMIGEQYFSDDDRTTAADVQHVWACCILYPRLDENDEPIPGQWREDDEDWFIWHGITADTQHAFPLTIVIR